MKLKIDHLRKKLRRERRRRTPSNFSFSSDDDRDGSYRPRSRTPPGESFSCDEDSPHKRRDKGLSCKGLGNDTMSKALNQIFRSPFTHKIGVKLPWRFAQPTFTICNGQTDLVEHVNYFNQRMVVHSKNEVLMRKVFPSSLELVAMRWFDGLREGSINFFKELTRAFGARFVTCSRVLQPLDSLLSMTMREGETLKTYLERYWEMFNEIDGDFDGVAIRTFKVGLPAEHDLRKSLTKKPVKSVYRLMDHIDEYKRVEEDQQQGKWKAKVIPQDRRDFRSDRYNNNRPQRDFARQSGSIATQVVGTVFRDPVHQVLEKIKNESYFRWPNKMGGDLIKRNQSLHCQYH